MDQAFRRAVTIRGEIADNDRPGLAAGTQTEWTLPDRSEVNISRTSQPDRSSATFP